MRLNIITGQAGTGKTHLLLEEMANQSAQTPIGSPLILLVPEQASFHAEWALLNDFSISGSLRIQVCGFRKLFHLLAKEQDLVLNPWLNDLGKSMILRRIVNQRQQDFQVFRKAARHQGFVNNLCLMMDELMRYGVTEDQLADAKERIAIIGKNQMTVEKLSDISLVYSEYRNLLQEKYCDETGLLQVMAEAVKKSSYLAEADVYMDGFTDFDPAQIAVVQALIKRCHSVSVALTMTEFSDLGEESVFAFPEKTFRTLKQFAEEEQIPLFRRHLRENHRLAGCSDLLSLERSFAQKVFRKDDCPVEHVRLIRAANREKQLHFVADEIWRLVRQEGYRLSDFAIISRQLEDCQMILEDVLEAHDIPYFSDSAKNMYHHPLIELILAMLETEAENWQSAAVLRYLKTGFGDLSAEELDLLENYALANGIKGSYWQKAGQWQRYYVDRRNQLKEEDIEKRESAAENLTAINKIGKIAVRPLLDFHFALKELRKTGGRYRLADLIQVIRQSLETRNVEKRLESWSSQAEANGHLELAAFHRQIFAACGSLLQQLTDFLGDSEVSLEEAYQLIKEGGSKMELNSIPPAVDEVLVCDISRTRLPRVKCAFVIDCNEGIFPMRVAEDGLLNSLERDELRGAGLHLALGKRQLQFTEDYHAYIAMTRASERLYLCYTEFDAALNPLPPSLILNHVTTVLPALQREEVQEHKVELVSNVALLTALETQISFARSGTEISEIWWQILKYYQEKNLYPAEINALLASANYQKDSGTLPADTLCRLYGEVKTTSVSRMETYNRCPCMYFGRYGLRLEPRQEFTVRSQDVGQIYHYILAEVLRILLEAKTDFSLLTAKKILPLIEQVLLTYNQKGGEHLFDDSEKNQYLKDKIIAVVTRCILDIAWQMAEGNFLPVGFEVSFGARSEIEGMRITLPDDRNVWLRGTIDRVDSAFGEQADYYRIIDYKSSDKQLDLNDIFYGLNWQMPLYLEALLDSQTQKQKKPVKPAGMFYFPIREWVDAVDQPAEEKGDRIQKLQGLIILDHEAIDLAERDFFTKKQAKTMNLKLNKDGSYGKNPYVIEEMDYNVIVAYIKRHLAANLQRMLSGDIRQLPLSKDNQLSCVYCDYCGLCILDNSLQTNCCKMEKQKPSEILLRMKKENGTDPFLKENKK